MPISLDELSSEVSEPLEVNVGTDDKPQTVIVTYRPNAITPALEDRIQGVAQRAQIGSVYRLMLLEVLESWDVEGTLPPIPYPDFAQNTAKEYADTACEKIDAENVNRTTPHVLAINAESLSLVPTSKLEKIIKAIQEEQGAKKQPSKPSAGSFGAAGAAPYRRGTG